MFELNSDQNRTCNLINKFIFILAPQASSWIGKVSGSSPDTIEQSLTSSIWPHVSAEIQAGVDRANSRAVSNVATVKKWKLVEIDFTVGGGELSPSLKLKRFHVADMYTDIIDQMYSEDSEK